jgi:hypothetical protein
MRLLKMSDSNPLPQINTGGGAAVGGSVNTGGGDFIGRDQIIQVSGDLHIVLQPVEEATMAARAVTPLLSQKDKDDTNIIADLDALTDELSKTHKTIVRVLSPLRRLRDDPATFGEKFREFYNDFKDFYDSQDYQAERTRCHVIRRFQSRLNRYSTSVSNSAEWQRLQSNLSALNSYDQDIIEHHYVPFMGQLMHSINAIMQLVDSGQIDEAIAQKKSLVSLLDPQYDKTKQMLHEMTDLSGALKDEL